MACQRNRIATLLSLLVLVILPTKGQADLYGFECITEGISSTDAQIGQTQFFVDVSDTLPTGEGLSGQVLFTFRNTGLSDSSITDVYFDDGSLLDVAYLIDGDNGFGTPPTFGDSGVYFSEGGSPGNLSGGNNISPPFQATKGFLADSDPPVEPGGVNPGEWLGIVFDLKDGKTFADVIAAMNLGLTNPWSEDSLRIGIRAQGFADEDSGSFVAVPVPAGLLLGLLGLGSAGLRLRKYV